MRSDGLLFAHILSAMILVGGVLTVVTVSAAAQQRAWPDQIPLLRALAFRTNLLIVLPGFIAVHVFGDLLANREYKRDQPDWLDIGFCDHRQRPDRRRCDPDSAPVLGAETDPCGRAGRLAGLACNDSPLDRAGGPRCRDHPNGRETRRLTEPLRNACFSHVQKA